MSLRTYKYRLYPTPGQARQMEQILEVCRHWYNMCLAERKYAYELEGRRITRSQQEKTGIHYRQTFAQARIVFSQTMQTVCEDVDQAFQAFFRRCTAGEPPGYPRFKGRGRFNSFAFKQWGMGARLDGRRLKLFGVGRVRMRWHRPLKGEVKTVRVLRRAGKWYACFACDVPDPAPLPATGKVVGIDVGVSPLLTVSDGHKVENPSYYRAGQRRLRILQRSLARKRRGGQKRRKALRQVQRQQQHVANQRADFLHKLSTRLIRQYDAVALEDLRINHMVKNHHLSKSILDSGWGCFKQQLAYKAESAGRQIALVDPAYTSRTCSRCGALFQDFGLSTRWVTCACGLSLDRDHNAAINVLRRAGWDASAGANVERVAHALPGSPRL